MANETPDKDSRVPADDFLEPYYHKPRFSFSFWRWVVMGLIFVAAVIFFKVTVLDVAMDAKELKSSIQLFDVSTRWVQKEKVRSPEFSGVVIVPEITFRMRNVGRRELKHVYCIAVFRFDDNGKLMGEGYRMTLRAGLAPGRESEACTLRSPFGVRASSLEAVRANQREWRSARVELFAHSRNSKTILLQEQVVSRRIEGLDIEVQVK